jgi:Cu/Ag efflux protein CusF
MKSFAIVMLLAALGAAGLGCKKQAEAPSASGPVLGEKHTAKGIIKKFGEGNKSAVVEHEAFADGFMEAMTMSFEFESPKLAKGLKVGDKVEFTLEYKGNAFPIVSVKKIKP